MSLLRVTEIRGTADRLLGGMAGAFLGLTLSGTAINGGTLGPEASVAAVVGTTTLSAMAGHHLGGKIDRRTTSIRIVSD